MKKMLFTMLLCVTTVANADILIFSPNGTYTKPTVQTLAAAAVNPSAEGRTVVVTSALTEAQSNISGAWPADRGLKIEVGGSLLNSTKFVFAPGSSFDSYLGYIFKGTGKIQGLTRAYPQWFGAVAGVAKSEGVRTTNTAALNAVWLSISPDPADFSYNSTAAADYGSNYWYGTVLIDGIIETNGDFIIGTAEANSNGKTVLRGVGGAEQSAIWGYGTENVIDATGRSQLSIQNLTIFSKTAKTGLLLGRVGSGQGHFVNLEGVKIKGQYSLAALVSIAAEDIHGVNCYIENSKSGASVYASSTRPDLIGVTSTLGTLTTSTNSDIKFINSTFFSNTTGMDVLRFDTYFDGAFSNCVILAGLGDTTNNLIKLIADPVAFNGKLLFNGGTLLEGASVTVANFSYIGTTDTTDRSYNDVSFDGVTFTNFGAGTVNFAYKTLAHATMTSLNMRDIKYGGGVTNTIILSKLQQCDIQLLNWNLTVDGYINASKVAALQITYTGTPANTQNSTIRDLTGKFSYLSGSGPVAAATVITPVGNTGNIALRGVFAPVSTLPTTPIVGELVALDAGYGGMPGSSASTGQIVPLFWDGQEYMTMGAVTGTPTSATATGLKGTILYDASYMYICVATNTWRRAAIAGGW